MKFSIAADGSYTQDGKYISNLRWFKPERGVLDKEEIRLYKLWKEVGELAEDDWFIVSAVQKYPERPGVVQLRIDLTYDPADIPAARKRWGIDLRSKFYDDFHELVERTADWSAETMQWTGKDFGEDEWSYWIKVDSVGEAEEALHEIRSFIKNSILQNFVRHQ